MFKSRYFKAIALAGALFAFSSYAAASGNFTTIDYPGAVQTQVWGINSAGDMVGGFGDAAGWHGFLLRNGTYTTIDYPGALWTDAYGINPRGDIVGQYGWFDGVNTTIRGFLLRDGEFRQIDIAGHQNTMPFKISPNGTIVGCLHENTSPAGGTNLALMYGFGLNKNGAIEKTLARSMNLGINPDGDVVGYYYGTSSFQPSNRPEWSYLIRDGAMTLFQYPGAYTTLATDISPNGTIVGRYRYASPTTFHGFVLSEGQFESFDIPGAVNTVPMGVNAKGDIVGFYTVPNPAGGVLAHGFLRQ